MTLVDASKSENKETIRTYYQRKYDDYNPKISFRFKISDVVRFYKFKTVFKKGITTNRTSEKFRVISVYDTKPLTYSIEDMQGKQIEGKFNLWEIRLTH